MTIQISKVIEQIKIQIEYTICQYNAPGNVSKDCEFKNVHSLSEFLKAVSSDSLADLKEEYCADEVFVSNIIIVSEDKENKVFTHLNPEHQITTMNVNVDGQDMADNLKRSLNMIEKQTDDFYQNIKKTINLYQKKG